jgi:predicted metal-dependent HD superfamily phosphohydrolase
VWFAQFQLFARRPGDIAFALFYHDAIYNPRASDNEEQSAKLAADIMREYVRGDCEPERVVSLILATKHDAVSEDDDARLLVDIDLSILGAEPVRFGEYERQIRKEYEWVAVDEFRKGRSQVLTKFLGRPAIYSTSFFQERLEAAARANLKRSLVDLGMLIDSEKN